MKKKSSLAVLASFVLLVSANATVTINIKTAGWGDASAAANDLAWGILIDTDGASFGGDFSGSFLTDLGAALNGFTIPSVTGAGGFGSGTSVFDEYVFVSGRALTTPSGPPTPGLAGYMNDLGTNLGSGIDASDDYGLLWFSTGTTTLTTSDTFGFQDLGTLPADGATITPSTTAGFATSAITVVPEPSTYAAIAGLVVLGFTAVRRRRRA